jgi:uncharacterized membrane protein
MSQILIASSTWFHSLATVILIGHYLLLGLIYIPALAVNDAETPNYAGLSEISKRSRTWMYVALLVFLITGVYLTLVDSNYLGIGNFSNPWAVLMLVKHLIVLAMIVAGFWFNAILRVGPLMRSNTGSVQALKRFRQYANIMAFCGVLVLLLTAIAQIE